MVDCSTVWLPDRQGSDRRMQSQPYAGSVSGATQLSARRRAYQRSRRMLRACRKHATGYGRRGRRDASSHPLSLYNLNYRKAKQSKCATFPTERARAINIANKAVKLSPSPGNLFLHLVSTAVPQVKEPTKNILYPQATLEALIFFYAAN